MKDGKLGVSESTARIADINTGWVLKIHRAWLDAAPSSREHLIIMLCCLRWVTQ